MDHSERTGSDAGEPGADDSAVGAQPGEGHKQRVDRELRELLEEIRVALPGIELLFGFLLILPFSERFGALVPVQRAIYLTCLVVTAASAALFLAPTANHRLGFRSLDKESLLLRSNRQIVAGLVLVSAAISLAVCLVVWVVLDSVWGVGIAAAIALWFVRCWFVPHWRRRRRQS